MLRRENAAFMTGVKHKKHLKLLKAQKKNCEDELVELDLQWKKEQVLIKNIRELRQQLESEAESPGDFEKT